MMDKYILLTVVCTLIASYAYARPAGSELDNVSVDDTSLNVVDPMKKPEISSIPIDTHKNGASVQITGISTGIDAPSSYDGPSSPPFKPQRAGTMFARFIDDVFNIPITVLQSVAKLITNPFTSKDKTHESH